MEWRWPLFYKMIEPGVFNDYAWNRYNPRVHVLCVSPQPCGNAGDLMPIKDRDQISGLLDQGDGTIKWDQYVDTYVTSLCSGFTTTQIGTIGTTQIYQRNYLRTLPLFPTTPEFPRGSFYTGQSGTITISGRKLFVDDTVATVTRETDDLVINITETDTATTRVIIEYDIHSEGRGANTGQSAESYNWREPVTKANISQYYANLLPQGEIGGGVWLVDNKIKFIIETTTRLTPTGEVDHFEVAFNGNTINVAVDTVQSVPGTYYRSAQVELELPANSTNDLGSIYITTHLKDNNTAPRDRVWLQAKSIINSTDGVGAYGGNFYSSKYFGFTYPVTAQRWLVGFEPVLIESHSGGGVQFIDEVAEATQQSFRDGLLYFDSADLDNLSSITELAGGTFYAPGGDFFPGSEDIHVNPSGAAVAGLGEETADFVNGSPLLWSWMDAYTKNDRRTEIEKYLCPTCPHIKVLSGNGAWGCEITGGNAIIDSTPVCTIDDQEFHNYTGWDGTAAKDGKRLYLAYHRFPARWEFWAGYRWEALSFMSIPFDGTFHLATISHLLEGTICALAWEVISATSYKLWFKKSINGGDSWENASEVTTLAAPQLVRVTQNLATGKYEIIGAGFSVTSNNGGGSWA